MTVKLTRQQAYELWIEYKRNNGAINIAQKARELGCSTKTIWRQFTKLRLLEKHGQDNWLKNYLAYRWKSGSGWSTWTDNPFRTEGESS